MMKKHLFFLTITPVQSFISQARKTHDLWAGSQILSKLMQEAARFLNKRGGDVIYPCDINGDSLPNRLFVEFEEVTPDALRDIGITVETVIQEAFAAIADNALKNTGIKNKPQGFDEQIRQHLEIRWLCYPCSDNYAQDYAELTKLAAALKNTRTFEQFGGGQGEQGRKCSLDGRRNALFYRPRPDNSAPAYLQKNALKVHHAKLIPGEGLSAVSLCKRYYEAKNSFPGTKGSFPGTAAVTLMDYIAKLDGKDLDLRALFDKDFDEQLFFEENLTPDYFRKQGLDTNKLTDAKTAQQKLPQPPTSYYALLAFDGDSMGTWLSGEYLPNKTDLHEFHQTLSEKLADFAGYAANYLQDPYGKAVYAGGDDFLGFINLAALFPVLRELRKQFKEQVAAPLREQFKLTQELTFSAGVVVAHYKTPLHAVLNYAREAEHAAKQINPDKKDALAIRVVKRSGEGNQAILPWYYDNEFMPDKLAKVIDDLRNGFSDTFARRLAAQFATHTQKHTRLDMFLSELKRLSTRAAPDTDKKERVKQLNDTMRCLLQASRDLYGCLAEDDDIKPEALDNFLQTLHIAVFLERQAKPEEK